MNRRGFLQGLLATVALTTGLARARLDLIAAPPAHGRGGNALSLEDFEQRGVSPMLDGIVETSLRVLLRNRGVSTSSPEFYAFVDHTTAACAQALAEPTKLTKAESVRILTLHIGAAAKQWECA